MQMITDLLQDAEFWVGIALIVFFALLVRLGVPRLAARALDSQAQAIKDQLEQAERLREEAQSLLERIRKERDDAERMSSQILADAEAQAERIGSEARVKLQEQIRHRSELAQRKIARAEAQAVAEVKAAAVELAASAAETVLATRLAAHRPDPQLDQGLEQLAGKFG